MKTSNCPFCGSDDTVIQLLDTSACRKCALRWFNDASQQAILSMRSKANAWSCVYDLFCTTPMDQFHKDFARVAVKLDREIIAALETSQITEEATNEND